MFNLKTLVKTAAITAVSLALAPAAFAGGHGKTLRIQSVLADNCRRSTYVEGIWQRRRCSNRRLIDASKFFQLVQLSVRAT